jgi:hypothetical protein
LPKGAQDQSAYCYWKTLKSRPSNQWPTGMSLRFRELLEIYIRKRAQEKSPLERCNAFVQANGALPTAYQDRSMNEYWLKVSKKSLSQWPTGMSLKFRELLEAYVRSKSKSQLLTTAG